MVDMLCRHSHSGLTTGMNRRILHIAILLLTSFAAITFHSMVLRWPEAFHGDSNSHVQERMNDHHADMNMKLDAIVDSLTSQKNADIDVFSTINDIGADDPYCYYVFKDNELIAWRNALLPIYDITASSLKNGMMRTDNGWYYVQSKESGTLSLFSLFRVRSRYSVDNDYLRTEFDPSLGVEQRSKIILDTKSDGLQITSPSGDYLFTIVKSGITQMTTPLIVLDFISLIIWIVCLIVSICLFTNMLAKMGYKNRSLLVLALLLAGVYMWNLYTDVSPQMAKWFIFSPQIFAYGWWAPSLYYLLLFTSSVFIWCYFLFRIFDFRRVDKWNFSSNYPGTVFFLLLGLLYAVYTAVNIALNIMVYNSPDLAIYIGEIDISGASLVKISIFTMLMLSFTLALERVYAEVARHIYNKKFVIVFGLFLLVVVLPSSFILIWFEKTFYIGFIVVNAVYFIIKKQFVSNSTYDSNSPAIGMRYSSFVWLMFFIALFITLRLTDLNTAKEKQNRELLTTNLAFSLVREDDPVAETLLATIESNIANDSIILDYFNSTKSRNDDGDLFIHIRESYFDGYFSRYDLQVMPCLGNNSYIHLSSTDEQYNCNEYFENMLKIFGVKISPKSNFYGLNDNDGQASYFGKFRYYNKRLDCYDHLYIEINQKSQTVESGYPELLTNSRDRIDTRQLKGYSYAKYIDGILHTTFGEYSYPRNVELTDSLHEGDRRFIQSEKYSHLAYQATPTQLVVLTYPKMTLTQFAADYSYIFLSMFIVSMLLLFIVGRRHGLIYYNMSIHERIQSTFVLFVMLLLVVICVLSVWESMNSFEQQSNTRTAQTLHAVKSSVILEIDENDQQEITPVVADNILQKATRMIVADAHLYSTDGQLIGTSCRELFDNGIVSPLINSHVLKSLQKGNDVLTQETLGNMDYLSAYSPITDINGETIGYLSVPYFNDVSAMRRQLMSTLMPISNAYMIVMLLAVLFSYFLAKGITKPLLAISQSIRKVELQKKNEKIMYKNTDEIGVLVDEYNRMIDELERSAEQLATTEREMTWREMARQIAHEIKNPLTPMKLSVQYMIKAWERSSESDEAMERFDSFIRKTSNTLIEQIDQMAFIASEFSNVAKMKQGEITRVDVAEKLGSTVHLYSKSENATVTYNSDIEHAYVMTNADQMISVFNNLIKNAIQSVPQDQHVDIAASIEDIGDNILIKVSDNGRGIEPEVREKIFKPNFTTKSTGMGLGLAIVKTIIVNAKGDIWFDTEVGKGTTFYIKLPKAE